MSYSEAHEPTGMMSFPAIDSPEFRTTAPTASVYVCEGDRCQAWAEKHILDFTGHDGIYTPFRVEG